MAFAQDLFEGFANAAGDTGTVNRIEKDRANKLATKHEELAAQTQSILNDVSGLQQKRAALDPKHPNYDKDVAANDQALHDARTTLTDLYHPETNPGALAHLGGFIRQHLSKNDAPKTPGKIKEDMSSRIAKLDAASATGSPDASTLSPEDKAKAERIQAGLEPRAVAPKAEAENWVVTDITKADGTKVSVQHNTKSGEWSDLAGNPIAKEQLAGATVAPKASGAGPIRAWKNKGGKMVSVLLDRATNKEIPGSENSDIQPPSNLAGRVTTGFYHFVDDNGQVHQVQETHTSMPAGAGGAGAGGGKSAPKTAGEAKDRILGHKDKDYSDTRTAYQGAIDRTKTMDQNLKNAQQGDQQAMLSLVANHIGMTLGAQRGARITQAVWNEAINSTPWLSKVAAKWGPDGYLSGVTLAPEQMQQMVRLAHEKTQTLKDHMDRLNSQREGGGTTTPAQPSGKAVSLAKAKLLPSMQGKSDEEVRAAIKASGHTVKP